MTGELALIGCAVIVAIGVTLLLAELIYGPTVDAALTVLDRQPDHDADIDQAIANVTDLRDLTREQLEDLYRDPATSTELRDEIERFIDEQAERRDYEQTARWSR